MLRLPRFVLQPRQLAESLLLVLGLRPTAITSHHPALNWVLILSETNFDSILLGNRVTLFEKAGT